MTHRGFMTPTTSPTVPETTNALVTSYKLTTVDQTVAMMDGAPLLHRPALQTLARPKTPSPWLMF